MGNVAIPLMQRQPFEGMTNEQLVALVDLL
jgi:hypothetical protein